MRQELERERSSLHQDKRRVGGLHTCTACQSKDIDGATSDRHRRSDNKLRAEAESSLAEAAEQLSEQAKLVQKLTQEVRWLPPPINQSINPPSRISVYPMLTHRPPPHRSACSRRISREAVTRQRMRRERSSGR